MSDYSPGGFVPGGSIFVFTPEGRCSNGHLLGRFDGGSIEHIVRREDDPMAVLRCRSLG